MAIDVGTHFSVVRNAAVGAVSLEVPVPQSAVRCMVFSDTNALVHLKDAAFATLGFDIPANTPVGGIPVKAKTGGNIEITSRDGVANLAIVSVMFEIE